MSTDVTHTDVDWSGNGMQLKNIWDRFRFDSNGNEISFPLSEQGLTESITISRSLFKTVLTTVRKRYGDQHEGGASAMWVGMLSLFVCIADPSRAQRYLVAAINPHRMFA